MKAILQFMITASKAPIHQTYFKRNRPKQLYLGNINITTAEENGKVVPALCHEGIWGMDV
jgi:hypothetical protein